MLMRPCDKSKKLGKCSLMSTSNLIEDLKPVHAFNESLIFIYFTYALQEPFGSVYSCTPDRRITKIDTGYLFSNGIAVQHNDQGKPELLIVAETGKKTLHAYDILSPGVVGNKRIWGILPGV